MELYDTMERRKRVFKPIHDKEVRIYSCGPTVYSYAHIGNMRPYIVVDMLKRLLKHDGYKVIHAMNITDVGHLVGDGNLGEDKIKLAAAQQHKTAKEVAMFYEQKFMYDMERLNIEKPNYIVRASEHVPEMLKLIEKLDEKGYLYKIGTGIYYDTSKFKDYGRLMNMDFERLNRYLKAGARIERADGIRNITDFAVWRFSKPEEKEMVWDCKYGRGFPGWHIECSTLSMECLGEHFDIHTGGIDHIPIHHTNEIAQSESATGKKFVNYWVHIAFLTVNGKKMSKSLHNVYTIQDLVDKGYSPMAFRYFIEASNYRKQLNFTFEALESASNTLNLLISFAHKMAAIAAKSNAENSFTKGIESMKNAFFRFANDDLNMPNAIAELHNIVKAANKRQEEGQLSAEEAKAVLDAIAEIDSVLGLNLLHNEGSIPKEAEELIAERESARKAKDFSKADEIRKRLLNEFHIKIEDTEKGPKWQLV